MIRRLIKSSIYSMSIEHTKQQSTLLVKQYMLLFEPSVLIALVATQLCA